MKTKINEQTNVISTYVANVLEKLTSSKITLPEVTSILSEVFHKLDTNDITTYESRKILKASSLVIKTYRDKFKAQRMITGVTKQIPILQ